jgi:hypothetical protein
MSDLQIIQQLLNGWHLDPKEIEKAKKIVKTLNEYLKQQKQ